MFWEMKMNVHSILIDIAHGSNCRNMKSFIEDTIKKECLDMKKVLATPVKGYINFVCCCPKKKKKKGQKSNEYICWMLNYVLACMYCVGGRL